jgi:PPOX class probable F420-dependent enzyme
LSDDPRLYDVLADSHLGTLATIKRDGRAQLSNVSYAFDPDRRIIRISTRAMLAKVANIRRDPRVSLLTGAKGGWSYAVAEGTALLSAVSEQPDDATVEELIDLYRAIAGEHPDWDDYRAAMVRDRRLVLTISVERAYGLIR